MKKRIAIIITRLDLGGAQQTALYLARHLNREKYDVHLIAGAGGYYDEYARSIPNLHLHLMKSFKHPIRPLSDLKAYREIKKYLLQNKIDLVHTHSSKAGIIGRMSAHACRIPVIVHSAHGFSFHESQNPIIHRLYVMLERYGARRTNELIAGGYDVMEYGLDKKVGEKDRYSVIYAGVDLDSFRNAQPDRNEYLSRFNLKGSIFTVGMVGNLKKQKNPLEFVEIANRVLDSDQDIQFIFAGDGPLRSEVNKRLLRYGIEDQVKFIGWVDDPQNFINSIDVFILTSLWEGLPCTLSQAIVSNKPCIATNIGGNREILKDFDSGFIYEPGQIERATEIIHLLKSQQLKTTRDENQEALLQKFDFQYIMKQHEQLYDKLLMKN